VRPFSVNSVVRNFSLNRDASTQNSEQETDLYSRKSLTLMSVTRIASDIERREFLKLSAAATVLAAGGEAPPEPHFTGDWRRGRCLALPENGSESTV
jgi:hypothetical protein